MREHENDRLWQGELPPDLERLRAQASALPLPAEPRWDALRARSAPRRATAVLAWLPWAAGFVALLGVALIARDSWRVESVSGRPILTGVAFAGRVASGGAVATDFASRARLVVPGVGDVILEPGGRVLRLVGRRGAPRVQLDRGTLRARVDAPSTRFMVETRAGSAVNLGGTCTIAMEDSGKGRLDVQRGQARFAGSGHESLLPSGVWCPLTGDGAGVPRRADASEAFLAAVAVTDNPACQADDFTPLLEKAEARDVITLWHLLPRVRGKVRRQVAERIASLVDVPSEVTIDQVLALEPAALEAWWNALGLGDFEKWR